MSRTALYRCFDSSGVLLYVGISKRFLRRMNEHQTAAPWASEMVKIEVQIFSTAAEAQASEMKAIKDERPLFNIRGNNVRGKAMLQGPTPDLFKRWPYHIALESQIKGGLARALSMSPRRRKQIARAAAKARWHVPKPQ